jgi:type VII secretion-associated serine protease mycosin
MLKTIVRVAAAVGVTGGLAFSTAPANAAPEAARVPANVNAGTPAAALSATGARSAVSDAVRGDQQWEFDMLDTWPAWQQTQGAGVIVAVLDSGVNPNVSDLQNDVITGPNLTGLNTPPSNPNWGVHGTWMASIIAGHGHDGGLDGVLGVAPDARILSIRVIPEKTDPEYRKYQSEPESLIQQSLATGILDAVKDGAKVISMSLGYTAPSSTVRSAVEYAFDHGVVLVASAGNSGDESSTPGSASTSSGKSGAGGGGFAPVSFPAQYPGVLSVAAVNQDGSVASFSSENLSVEVAAPGFDVTAQGRDGQYWSVSGTSPACALVAGVAALIKSKYPGLAPDLVLRAIISTARGGQYGGYNAKTGFGVVDAAAALSAAGRLAGTRPAGSQVAASARFGGGPRDAAAAPVPARGSGPLVIFSVLGVLSLAVAIGGGVWFGRVRRARRYGYRTAAGPDWYSGTHAAFYEQQGGSEEPGDRR